MLSCRTSFVAPLVFFVRPVSCFLGRPPLVYDVPLCFCCLAQSSRAPFQRWLSSGHFPDRFFCVFSRVLDQFVDLREAGFAVFLRCGSARAHICASWRRQATNSEANGVTKSIFPPPRGSLFGPLFFTFSYFSEFCDFVKIELPCRRELDFEGPGRSKYHFFLLGALSKNLRGPRAVSYTHLTLPTILRV